MSKNNEDDIDDDFDSDIDDDPSHTSTHAYPEDPQAILTQLAAQPWEAWAEELEVLLGIWACLMANQTLSMIKISGWELGLEEDSIVLAQT